MNYIVVYIYQNLIIYIIYFSTAVHIGKSNFEGNFALMLCCVSSVFFVSFAVFFLILSSETSHLL